jgi:hypothetical protein
MNVVWQCGAYLAVAVLPTRSIIKLITADHTTVTMTKQCMANTMVVARAPATRQHTAAATTNPDHERRAAAWQQHG